MFRATNNYFVSICDAAKRMINEKQIKHYIWSAVLVIDLLCSFDCNKRESEKRYTAGSREHMFA